MTNVRRIVLRLVATVVAIVAVAGCGVDRLGAAAVVDGHKISIDQLQDLTREFTTAVPGQESGQAQAAILQQLILRRVLAAQARDAGVRVSDGRVASQLSGLITRLGGRKQLAAALAQQGQVVAPSQFSDWLRGQLLFQRIARKLGGGTGAPSQEALAEADAQLRGYSRRAQIEVNPRYGSWNARSGVTPLVGGGLSTTVDQLSTAGN